MKQRILKILRFFVFLFTALFLLYLAFRGIDLSQVWQDLKHARYIWLGITIPAGILSHIFRAWRWNLLIEPLNYKPKLSHTFYAVMSGYLANLALPRLGEVVRCGSLTKTDKVPFDALLGTVITERIVDFLFLVLLLLITFFIKINFFGHFFVTHIFHPLGTRFSTLFSYPITLLSITGIVILIILAIWILRKKIMQFTLIRKTFDFLTGIIIGIKTIASLKNKPMFILSSFLIWLMYYFTAWLVMYMLPETSSLTPLDGLFLLVVGSIAMVIPVQGGIGAYHWLMSLALLNLYGIPKETGLVLATLAHESQTLMILIVGSFSIIMIVLQKNKNLSLASKEE